jgi:hypothetical protein
MSRLLYNRDLGEVVDHHIKMMMMWVIEKIIMTPNMMSGMDIKYLYLIMANMMKRIERQIKFIPWLRIIWMVEEDLEKKSCNGRSIEKLDLKNQI